MYRETAGFMYLRKSNDFGVADVSYFFGDPGDTPPAGDWDGDGCDTVNIYRPIEGKVYVINSLGTAVADFAYYFGNPGVPLVASASWRLVMEGGLLPRR